MAIRIRRVDGAWVALCAARSVEKPGDVYLDDGLHYALAQKFWEDYGMPYDAEDRARRAIEESNNPNRDEWDRVYGPPDSPPPSQPGDAET